MAALTSDRPGSIRKLNRDARPVAAGAKGFKGGLCMAIIAGTSRGYVKQGAAPAAGQVAVAVGRFYADFDNTTGADGDITAEVQFFKERAVFLCGNDSGGTPVVVADRESSCQVLDDQTVTDAAGARGGNVYDVTSEGVWVEVDGPIREVGAPPQIQTGSSTLVAGTKIVTGVTLTSGSKIVITMKDPGAGAITGMGSLDIPVGTRTSSQFVVNAIDDSKALITTAVCTFDYVIVG